MDTSYEFYNYIFHTRVGDSSNNNTPESLSCFFLWMTQWLKSCQTEMALETFYV